MDCLPRTCSPTPCSLLTARPALLADGLPGRSRLSSRSHLRSAKVIRGPLNGRAQWPSSMAESAQRPDRLGGRGRLNASRPAGEVGSTGQTLEPWLIGEAEADLHHDDELL